MRERENRSEVEDQDGRQDHTVLDTLPGVGHHLPLDRADHSCHCKVGWREAGENPEQVGRCCCTPERPQEGGDSLEEVGRSYFERVGQVEVHHIPLRVAHGKTDHPCHNPEDHRADHRSAEEVVGPSTSPARSQRGYERAAGSEVDRDWWDVPDHTLQRVAQEVEQNDAEGTQVGHTLHAGDDRIVSLERSRLGCRVDMLMPGDELGREVAAGNAPEEL